MAGYFDKKRERSSERTTGKKGNTRPSILIVSEGEKTEYNYFMGLKDYINNIYSHSVTHVPVLRPEGLGYATLRLVEEVNGILIRRKQNYKEIWIVFDEDGDVHFDKAVRAATNKEARKKGFRVGWSNKSFEYWLVLHFMNTASPVTNQSEWERRLDDIFRRRGIAPNGYNKNDPKLFEYVTEHGSLKNAVAYAKRVDSNYREGMLPSQCNPCTKVYQLIESLAPYIPELLE